MCTFLRIDITALRTESSGLALKSHLTGLSLPPKIIFIQPFRLGNKLLTEKHIIILHFYHRQTRGWVKRKLFSTSLAMTQNWAARTYSELNQLSLLVYSSKLREKYVQWHSLRPAHQMHIFRTTRVDFQRSDYISRILYSCSV